MLPPGTENYIEFGEELPAKNILGSLNMRWHDALAFVNLKTCRRNEKEASWPAKIMMQ